MLSVIRTHMIAHAPSIVKTHSRRCPFLVHSSNDILIQFIIFQWAITSFSSFFQRKQGSIFSRNFRNFRSKYLTWTTRTNEMNGKRINDELNKSTWFLAGSGSPLPPAGATDFLAPSLAAVVAAVVSAAPSSVGPPKWAVQWAGSHGCFHFFHAFLKSASQLSLLVQCVH